MFWFKSKFIYLKDRLDTLKEINLPIWLTEVDIVEKDPHKRAVSLENVMRVGFSHPSVHGIILWCFWNLKCWRGPDTGLVDGDNFTVITSEDCDHPSPCNRLIRTQAQIISYNLQNHAN
jgi:hypothetical protein